MKAALLASACILLPALASAQADPGLQATSASAAMPGMVSASSSASAQTGAASAPSGPTMPPGMPPAVNVLSPSARLNPKETRGVGLARRWVAAPRMPHAGADGVIRYLYGATLATVVCAPLQVCDLSLQPGEVVNNINAGDKVQWSITPGISGSPEGTITHLLIKPVDAGLVSSMTILTNKRSYAVKLVSTQSQWMPHIGWTYPDDQQQAWGAYQQAMGTGAAFGSGVMATSSAGIGGGAVSFYAIACEGSPSWTPRRAWTDGTKMWVEFPGPLNAGAPAFVGLGNDGGWFSKPSTQVVNYRPMPGNRYMADAALDRAALISGVGGSEQRCTLRRERAR